MTFLAKAQDCGESAKLLFQKASYEGACDRAFYAMFNAARALLATRGLNSSKIQSHTKVRALMKRHFVSTGQISPEIVGHLAFADKARRLANYSFDDIPEPIAQDVIVAMDAFLRDVTAQLHLAAERKRGV